MKRTKDGVPREPRALRFRVDQDLAFPDDIVSSSEDDSIENKYR